MAFGGGEGNLFCWRCDDLVRPLRPWHGWKPLWTVWRIGLVGVLALSPLLAADWCVMLPSMMLYIAAGGPLRSYAKEPPTCSRCSLPLDENVRSRDAIPRER